MGAGAGGTVGGPPWDVAFVHDSRRFDGMLVMMDRALAALQGSNIRIRAFTCYDPSLADQYPDLGTRVAGYKIPFGGDLERGVNRLLPVFARRLRDLRANLIHLWSPSLAAVIPGRNNVLVTVPDLAKLTTRYYGRIPSYLHNRLLPLVARANTIVCHTEWTRQEIVRWLRVPPERIAVVRPWTDVVGTERAIEREFTAPQLGRPWTLLAVAVDRPNKNLAFFLEVLARLDTRYRGLVVGRPTGPTRARVQALGLASRVEFRTGVQDTAPIYDSAHLLLHPSLHEGFGLPLLEGMARRVPVIASNRTCIPEVMGSGGLLLAPDDPGVWARAVESLADEIAYREAVARAVRRAGVFTREGTRDALLRTYEAALARARG
jgi:glycosyltransferase involved in cell wall biosynthesis